MNEDYKYVDSSTFFTIVRSLTITRTEDLGNELEYYIEAVKVAGIKGTNVYYVKKDLL